MNCGKHEADLALLHRTYVRVGAEVEDDFAVVCSRCAADKYGLRIDADDAGDVLLWDPDQYPYDGAARPGHPCFRPGPQWAPSLNEIEHRLRVGVPVGPR
jgi:hypothetical protein